MLTWAAFRHARPDLAIRRPVAELFLSERDMDGPPPRFDDEALFEFRIETCLLTRTKGHGDYDPQHTVWKAG